MQTNKILQTPFYSTGNFWLFNNGQYSEKTEIMQQDCYQLQIINGKVRGLYFWQNNNTGGQRLNSGCYPIATLDGKKLAAYNELIKEIN